MLTMIYLIILSLSLLMIFYAVLIIKHYRVDENPFDANKIFSNQYVKPFAILVLVILVLTAISIDGEFRGVNADAKEDSELFSRVNQEELEKAEVPEYSDLLLNKTKYEGKKIKLIGRIDQIIERNNFSIIILNVANRKNSNDNNDIVYIEYRKNTNLVSGDNITVYGAINTDQVIYSTYVNENQSRYKFSIPSFSAEMLTE